MDNGASSYRRFLDGDDNGIIEIVNNYKDGLILYLNGYVNNIFIAEELTEDTFFRLIIKKPKYSGKSTFKSWLYAIGRNVAVDYILLTHIALSGATKRPTMKWLPLSLNFRRL